LKFNIIYFIYFVLLFIILQWELVHNCVEAEADAVVSASFITRERSCSVSYKVPGDTRGVMFHHDSLQKPQHLIHRLVCVCVCVCVCVSVCVCHQIPSHTSICPWTSRLNPSLSPCSPETKFTPGGVTGNTARRARRRPRPLPSLQVSATRLTPALLLFV